MNGLARSESQILQTLAGGPPTFGEVFAPCAKTEKRVYCGDLTFARYIERMRLCPNPMVTSESGDSILAPHGGKEYQTFVQSAMVMSHAGFDLLDGRRDWIQMGGSDRWLGGVHLDGRNVRWRWNPEDGIVQTEPGIDL